RWRRWRTCSPWRSRTSPPRESDPGFLPGSGRGKPCHARCSAWPARRRGEGCLQQMVFGAFAVADDPGQIPALLRAELLSRVLGAVHPLGGIEPSLNALGELHLLLGVQQRDLADLLEIRAYRISRGGGFGVLAGLAQRLGFLLVPDQILRVRLTGCLSVLAVYREVLDVD